MCQDPLEDMRDWSGDELAAVATSIDAPPHRYIEFDGVTYFAPQADWVWGSGFDLLDVTPRRRGRLRINGRRVA